MNDDKNKNPIYIIEKNLTNILWNSHRIKNSLKHPKDELKHIENLLVEIQENVLTIWDKLSDLEQKNDVK